MGLDSQDAVLEGTLGERQQQRQGGPEGEVTQLRGNGWWSWHQNTGRLPLHSVLSIPHSLIRELIHSSGNLFTQQTIVKLPVCASHVQRISCRPQVG